MGPVPNACVFSRDRAHRYELIHRFNDRADPRLILWIGLNPSIADEQRLDRTLTRIASFSRREGFDGFVMANLFTLVTTYPKVMRAHPRPVSAQADAWLRRSAARCERIVVAWGAGGEFRERGPAVLRLLGDRPLLCLGRTQAGHPRHPLYVAGAQPLVAW
jgi:hypothetical protein